MTTRSRTVCLLLAVGLSVPAWAATDTSRITAADLGPGQARVIVKFRSADVIAAVADEAPADLAQLVDRTGVPLRQQRQITSRMRVVVLDVVNAPGSVSAAIDRLREDPRVQYAELDRHRRLHLAPNDPIYSKFSSDSDSEGQWYLRPDEPTTLSPDSPAAIDATSAWDVTTGSTGVVIAVLDTGVRYDHPDLGAAGSGGKLLPGYDFVSNTVVANDGDGWDRDPSDPGDWVTSSDRKALPFSDCTVTDSSWHGTRVSGIIGALTNNATGVAGINWSGWVLPVRVLGKCGGFDSDITAAMLWAGGLPVSGAPANPYPARIINLSLGGGDTCPAGYQDAIAQLRSRGVLVVASAGNEGGIVEAPANCPGVVAVAGLRQAGTKVGFSNLGPGITLSAPAGNCIYTGAGQPCIFSIGTTTNLGPQGPGASTYTTQYNYNVGTSFSAPIVSGIAGLMLAVNGPLPTQQLISRLREGAKKPFPVSSALDPDGNPVPTCQDPATAGVQATECNCTSATCGAGMANAPGAVAAALRPLAVIRASGRVAPGQALTLHALPGSHASCGDAGLSAFSWTVVSGTAPSPVVGADTDQATVMAPTSGTYTVRLTVTDSAGRQDTADAQIAPTTVSTTSSYIVGTAACPVPLVVVSVAPLTATTQAGGASVNFTASVANTASTGVAWYVDDVPGGDASVGTISASGVYTPPSLRPSGGQVIVKAVPVADPSRWATATVTVALASGIGGGGSGSGGGGGGGGGTTDLAWLALAIGAAAARMRRHAGRTSSLPDTARSHR